MTLAQTGKHIDGITILRDCLDKDHNDALAHYYISCIYAMENNEDAELQHLTELKRIKILPIEISSAEIFLRMAQINYKNGKIENALNDFLLALSFDEKNEIALCHIAFIAVGQKLFTIAEKYFQILVTTFPEKVNYHAAYGVTLVMLNKYNAIDEFDKALRVEPENETVLLFKIITCFLHKKYTNAAGAIQTLLEKTKEEQINYITHKLATAICYQNKNYDDAIGHANSCIQLSKSNNWIAENTDAYLSLIYIFIKIEDSQKTIEYINIMESLYPENEIVSLLSNHKAILHEQNDFEYTNGEGNFHFPEHIRKWLRTRITKNAIYELSGLAEEEIKDINRFFPEEKKNYPKSSNENTESDHGEKDLIFEFNRLNKSLFEKTCAKIVSLLGHTIENTLRYNDTDGINLICHEKNNKANRALFCIRKWHDHTISDLFLREQQNLMKEQFVSQCYIIANANLTSGATSVLEKVKNIHIHIENNFLKLLEKVI